MKIILEESHDHEETEIIIKYKYINEEIKRIVSLLKSSEKKVLGILQGEDYFIEPQNILYFESVDKKTFMYTETEVFETPLRLYEIEDKLGSLDFFRASKSTIINISKIKKLSPKFNGRLEALLENNERLIISRQYVPFIKEILEL